MAEKEPVTDREAATETVPIYARRVWILQVDPEVYDLAENPQRDNLTWYWGSRQYRKTINVGDIAYLWQSGKQAPGLYGWAVVKSQPYEVPEKERGRYQTKAETEVALDFRQQFDPPIPRQLVQSHPGLALMTIIRSRAGTVHGVRPVVTKDAREAGIEETEVELLHRFVAGQDSSVPIPRALALGPTAIQVLERAFGMTPVSEIHMDHLLLGLVADPQGLARRLLSGASVDEARLRATLRPPIVDFPTPESYTPATLSGQLPPLSDHARQALVAADSLAAASGAGAIDSGHLFQGWLSIDACHVVQAIQELAGFTLALRLENDVPSGPDLLNVEVEVEAIADAIALRDMTPPLVVGVLGGWGSGKSFALHLLEQRLRWIRGQPLPAAGSGSFPFVGHIYPITFDAWTYAKTDLWASLIQTVFTGLSRQLGVEQALREALKKTAEPDRDRPDLWLEVTRKLDEGRRLELEENPLVKQALAAAAAGGELAAEALWQEIDDLRKDERKNLEAAESKLAEERRALEEGLEEYARNDALKKTAGDVARTFGVNLLEKLTGKDNPTIKDLKVPLHRSLKGGPTGAGMSLLGLALILFLLPFVMQTDWVREMGWMGGAISMVLSLLASWASSRRQVEESYDGHLAAARERLVPEQLAAAPATAAVDSALAGLIEQERGVRRLEAEVESHRRNVGVTRRRVLDFVKGRLDSRYYDDRLGLLHQIQQDLESLTDTLMSLAGHDSATFPRGEPRVILMIDDLDRCPPPRVVEVLEAAQLLVKTRLFVVVLAMDVRYITRALEKSYAGVLSRDGDPSGLDYIEKIVQIPYRIRPIQRTAMEPYLSLLMGLESAPGEVGGESRPRPTPELEDAPAEEPPEEEAAVEEDGADGGGTEASDTDSRRPAVKTSQAPASGASETGGDDSGLRELERKARILKFSRTELRRLRDACTAVSMSPRAAKRLVNICKLFKLIWDERYPRDQGPSPGVQQATLILLALAARYPVVMREVLYDLEEVARRGSSTDGCQAYLEQRWQGVPHPPRHAGHWQEVLGILNGDAFPESLRFATAGGKAGGDRFTEDDIRLVSSFSFVGEADGQ